MNEGNDHAVRGRLSPRIVGNDPTHLFPSIKIREHALQEVDH
jgi:hypothetical protein